MTCYRPLKGYKGETTENGKNPVVFDRSKAQTPVELMQVPCGKCIGCNLEYSRQWAVRIMHEKYFHTSACFLTLTYNEENLPALGKLKHRDLQLFMKRLRKFLWKNYEIKVRYYLCGEYGGETLRPHYHVALFGFNPNENGPKDGELHQVTKMGHRLYISKTVENLWGKGFCPYGDLTFESAAYIARYVLKKRGEKKYRDNLRYAGRTMGQRSFVDTSTGELVPVDRVKLYTSPEYARCSNRPGIGFNWIHEFGEETAHSDSVVINGREQAPPRYYQKHIEETFPEIYENNKTKRLEKVLDNPEEYSWERQEAKERIRTLKVNHSLKRNKI